METITITILDEKVKETIQKWKEEKLIAVEKDMVLENFLKTLEKVREKGRKYPITLEEITKEVEKVRQRRYDAQKSSN